MRKTDYDFEGNNIVITPIRKNTVRANGYTFFVQQNERGAREKFWLARRLNNKEINNLFLFKANMYHDSNEDIGEVLYYQLAKQVGLKSCQCQLATYLKDGKKQYGIVSKNYRLNDELVELSGKTLLQHYSNVFYDNNNGKTPYMTHSVKTYVEALKYLFPNQGINFKQIETSLSKMAILDYLTYNVDTHWQNITFLFNEKEGLHTLKAVEGVDKGNIFYLHKHTPLRNTYLQQMKNGDKQFMQSLLGESKQHNPAFSITVPTTFANMSSDCQILNQTNNTGKTFAQDLAESIVKNPELTKFYNSIQKNLNLESAFEFISHYSTHLTPETQELSNLLLNNRMEQLKTAVLEAQAVQTKPNNNETETILVQEEKQVEETQAPILETEGEKVLWKKWNSVTKTFIWEHLPLKTMRMFTILILKTRKKQWKAV